MDATVDKHPLKVVCNCVQKCWSIAISVGHVNLVTRFRETYWNFCQLFMDSHKDSISSGGGGGVGRGSGGQPLELCLKETL